MTCWQEPGGLEFSRMTIACRMMTSMGCSKKGRLWEIGAAVEPKCAQPDGRRSCRVCVICVVLIARAGAARGRLAARETKTIPNC